MSLQQDQQYLNDILDAAHVAAREFLEGLSMRPAGRAPEAEAHDLLPEEGLGAIQALAAFRSRYEVGLSASPGPRYLGFVTGGSTPAALAGDWLVSAYDQNVSSDGDSIATTVERETLGLLRSLFGLPDLFEGAFVTGATMANFVALATARQWAAARLGRDVSEHGLWGLPPLPVLGGSPHASVIKALSMLGMGRQVVEHIALLPGRMAVDPAALEARLAALDGLPAIVVASAGEVNTGDFDDLEQLAALCRRYNAWLHVDGAFGLFAACDPAHEHLLRGLDAADSITVDGHKWLNVPYDAGFVFTRHLDLQQQVFKVTAAYLMQYPQNGPEIVASHAASPSLLSIPAHPNASPENGPGASADLMHRTPEDSRRFRALPAWMTLMAYGRSGYREVVARCCSLAQQFGQGIESSPHFELLSPVFLNIVCFTLRGADTARRDQLLVALMADGTVLLTPTHFAGKPAIRAAFANWSTSGEDVTKALEALQRSAGAPL